MSKPATKARIGSATKSVRHRGASSASSDAGSDAGSAAGNGASAVSALKFASDASHDGGSSSSRSSSKAVVKQVAAASLVPGSLEDRRLQLAEIDPSCAEANGKAKSSFAMGTTKSEKMKNVWSTAVADGQLVFDKKEPWTQEEREAYIRKKVKDSLDMPTIRFLDKAVVGAPLPEPWATSRDRKGRLYFVNEEEQDPAKKSSWKHPNEDTIVELAPIAKGALETDADSRQSYVRELHAYWTQEAEDKLAKWSDAQDDKGTTYYYNSETLETMWENPAEIVLPEYRVKLNAIAMLADEDRLAEFLAERSPEVAQVQGSHSIEPAALAPVPEEVDNTALAEPDPLPRCASGHLDVIATRTPDGSAVGHLVERAQAAKPDEDDRHANSLELLSNEIASIREENARLQREALEAQEKARTATAHSNEIASIREENARLQREAWEVQESVRTATAHPDVIASIREENARLQREALEAQEQEYAANAQALEAERMQHDAQQAEEAQAQAAAEATALGGERLQELLKQHQQSIYQQEEWQQERQVLHAEAKAAAEAKVGEEMRKQQSNFQQEEWQREREALHGELSIALEQKVAARAKAQAAAEAKILEEERLLNQRSTFQQEEWQRERGALLAELRGALEHQEAHQALEADRMQRGGDEDDQHANSFALLSNEIASIREENARLQRKAFEAQEKEHAATSQALEAERMQHDAKQAEEAQAQAAAEATALGGERLQELLKQHQQSTYQQEEWQQERQVLHAEAKAAAEAKISEEARQPQGNFQQQDWRREREALHAELSTALEQKVAARAKAQATADAKILEEERLLHQRSTFQQEEWQREREALHAEFRSALEQQEAHQAEAALLREQLEATQLRPEGFAETAATPVGSPHAANSDIRLPSAHDREPREPLLFSPAPSVNILKWSQQDLPADPRRPANSNLLVETLRYPHIETDILEEVRQQQSSSMALQEVMQQQLEDVAQSCQQAVHLAESTAAETLNRLKEVADSSETLADSTVSQKLPVEEAITHLQAHQDAMQQQFMSQVNETMNLHTSRLQEMNEVLALQGAGLLREEATQARHAEQLRESLDVQSGKGEAAQALLAQELRESFDAQHRRDEATQKRLTEELRESLEVQRAMLSEAQACSELAAKHQAEEAVESKAKARRDFEKEIQQALEEKQRHATEANNALAEALQKQIKDTFAPLAQHLDDAERRQQDSLSAAQAQKDRAQKQELCDAKEAEQQTREMQARMELAVQDQISKAMDGFKGQLQDVERARLDETERAKRAELERRACMEDEKLARQRAEQKAQRDLKEQEERRKADTARLEEELRTAREGALKRREEEVRRQMEWRDESREMQWRAENRELEWKSEVRQMEWQMDWQKAKLVEESELLRPTEAVRSVRRSRSDSRVCRELLGSVAAAQGILSDIAPPNRHSGSKTSCLGPAALALKVPGGRANARSASAGSSRKYNDKWQEAEDCIERLVDHAVPTTVATGLGFRVDLSPQDLRSQRAKQLAGSGSIRQSRNSSRPSSAVPLSRRSLAEEVAADLDGLAPMDTSSSPSDSARDQCNAVAPTKAIGQHSSSSGMSYRDVASTLHSTKWFAQQRSKQKGSKAKVAEVLCLDQVRSAYPEVSQILAVGAL